jgi:hypothetical protein
MFSALFQNLMYPCRLIEDYAVVYLGSAIFKIARLLVVATFSVHFFACVFYRVKLNSAASEADVVEFYVSRNVQENVSTRICITYSELHFDNLFLFCSGSIQSICEESSQ